MQSSLKIMLQRNSKAMQYSMTAMTLGGLGCIVPMTPVLAQKSPASAELLRLRMSLDALKAEQRQTTLKIMAIENALASMEVASEGRETYSGDDMPERPAIKPESFAQPSILAARSDEIEQKLDISGDLRLRYEINSGDKAALDRHRQTLRARLRASYAATDWLTVGAQIVTGEPNDPNSTDVTLSNFDDDFEVSLDQAYATLTFGKASLTGGKFALPFSRTDMVWDGDVSPQGASAVYETSVGDSDLKASSLYFVIDESVAGNNSRMFGGQGQVRFNAAPGLSFEAALGYYDYRLNTLSGADSGDFRGNLVSGGRYVSDFNLLDAIAAVNWSGFDEKWPIRLVGDYVKNYGAAVDDDSGYNVEIIAGRSGHSGDWRLSYGYSDVGVDAVLAAFSQDNTNISTNYRQHSFGLDYSLANKVTLQGLYYKYRRKIDIYAGSIIADDWINRFRVNFLVGF